MSRGSDPLTYRSARRIIEVRRKTRDRNSTKTLPTYKLVPNTLIETSLSLVPHLVKFVYMFNI